MGRRIITAKTKKAKGPSAQYVTRAGALKRTQLDISDFRRLCILKGIYPRVPKRKFRGSHATYYHLKDIASLNKDKLLATYRQEKAHQKKIRRARGRDEPSLVKHYRSTKPTPTLDHIVRERYPTFLDAVRDLDDPLSTLALFAALPTDNDTGLTPKSITHSTVLLDQFHFFVSTTGALTKIFASIKGYYLQANILGHPVTWLIPHQYTQDLPAEVDYKVLLTFQELYDCIVKFVNFKLYTMTGIEYPPPSNARKRKLGLRHLAFSENTSKDESVPVENTTGTDIDDVDMKSGENKVSNKSNPPIQRSTDATASLFSGLVVFLSREVPLGIMSIALISGGATVCWDDPASSPVDIEDPSITHHIVDRPAEQLETFLSQSVELAPREYVQPQWALDCLNSAALLPTAPYRPGRRPPPHLSPFVNDEEEGYIPDQRSVLDKMVAHNAVKNKNNTTGTDKNTTGTDNTESALLEDDEDEVEAAERNTALAQRYELEIEAERKGEWFSKESALRVNAALTPGGTTDDTGGDNLPELLATQEAGGDMASRRVKRSKLRAKDEEARRAALLSNRKRKLKSKLESDKEATVTKAKKLQQKKKLRADADA